MTRALLEQVYDLWISDADPHECFSVHDAVLKELAKPEQQERKPDSHDAFLSYPDMDAAYKQAIAEQRTSNLAQCFVKLYLEAQQGRKPEKLEIPPAPADALEVMYAEGWNACIDAQTRERKPMLASDIVMLYSECPTSDADMIEFAREVEAFHNIKETP